MKTVTIARREAMQVAALSAGASGPMAGKFAALAAAFQASPQMMTVTVQWPDWEVEIFQGALAGEKWHFTFERDPAGERGNA